MVPAKLALRAARTACRASSQIQGEVEVCLGELRETGAGAQNKTPVTGMNVTAFQPYRWVSGDSGTTSSWPWHVLFP